MAFLAKPPARQAKQQRWRPVIPRSGGQVALVVGGVMGHGLSWAVTVIMGCLCEQGPADGTGRTVPPLAHPPHGDDSLHV